MIQTKTIWQYWFGPPKIELLVTLEGLLRSHLANTDINLISLTMENLDKYFKMPPNFQNLNPAHQADVVRANVICDYGGVWFDSDTIPMKDLERLFDNFDNGFFVKEDRAQLCNGVFGSNPQTPLMIAYKNAVNEKFASGDPIAWNSLGTGVLNELDHSLFSSYTVLRGVDTVYPVHFSKGKKFFLDKPKSFCSMILRDFQPFIILTRDTYSKFTGFGDNALSGLVELSKAQVGGDVFNVFDKYYATMFWEAGKDLGGGGSGPGSSLANSRGAFSILREVILKHNIFSILDAGCGAMRWQKILLEQFEDISFTGVDAAASVIEKNKKTLSKYTFVNADLVDFDFPETDLILCRDTFMHLPIEFTQIIIEKMRMSGSKFLLLGSYKEGKNVDISVGDWYKIDLTQPPFKIQTDAVFDESVDDKQLLLVKL